MLAFDPVSATEDEIVDAARWLEGKSLREIGYYRLDHLDAQSSAQVKHVPGHIYEGYFNIVPDSDPRPDFRSAGIELKSTGLRVRFDGSIGQKERLSLRMLGRFNGQETWETSSLRHKLEDLILVFYGYEAGIPIGSFRTLRVLRYRPSKQEVDLLRDDWTKIQRMRSQGIKLSDSATRVLAASTKGAAGSETRGFSLKPRFVHYLYQRSVGAATAESLVERFGGVQTFEERVIGLLDANLGRTIDDIATGLGLPHDSSLNAQATVIRKLLGLPARGTIAEFQQFGLQVKTVPMSPSGTFHEKLSFPSFRPVDLATETWEESELLTFLNRLLLIPLLRPSRRGTPRGLARLGQARFWSPSASLLDEIRMTWEAYRQNVAAGRPDRYPRQSDGGPIFVRSHGQTAEDLVETVGADPIMRRSFWLHPDVVAQALGI